MSVARFNSASVIASGLAKLDFNSESADCRSASPNESIIWSVVGGTDGDGAGDLVVVAEPAAVGGAEGAGVWP